LKNYKTGFNINGQLAVTTAQ